MSVVFEDINGEPIGALRVFAPEVSGRPDRNLCKSMIDCDLNPCAKKACKDSDADAARTAAKELKTYLYRCHRGLGFPNVAIPIKIWENIVIGNLYAGQFLFKFKDKKEREEFIRKLNNSSNFYIEDVENFTKEWTDKDVYAFYEKVIPIDLRSTFKWEDFKQQFNSQLENGLTPDEFFENIEILEKLANYLSELGNELYTLKAIFDLEENLCPVLKARYDVHLEILKKNVRTLLLNRKESPNKERLEAVKEISTKSRILLVELKNYEEKVIERLFNIFKNHLLQTDTYIIEKMVQFSLLRCSFEITRYLSDF